MVDAITRQSWTTYDSQGNLVEIPDLYFGVKRPWHGKGFFDGQARRVKDVAREMGLPQIYFIMPKFTAPDGREFYADMAMIAREMGDGEQPHVYKGTVKVGDRQKFLAMNEDKLRPTKSPFYNLVTPNEFVKIFDEEVRQADGSPVETESMGFLGSQGSRGMFIVIKMPDYEIAGQEIRGYLTAWNPIERGATIHILNSDVCVVCDNTLRMAVQGAHRMVRVPHTVNAEDMLRGALGVIWGQALAAQRAGKEAGDFMAQTEYTPEQLSGLLKAVFPTPKRPDIRRLTRTDADQRLAQFEARLTETNSLRMWTTDIVQNGWGAGMTGVTDDNAGSAWAAYQGVTFVASHLPGKNDRAVMTSTLLGDRGQMANRAFVQIMRDIAPAMKTEDIKIGQLA